MSAPHVVVGGSYGLSTRYVVESAPAPGETVLAGLVALDHGGKGSNQAVAAARLGADVDFITAIGLDAAGAGAHTLWEREGVRATAVTSSDPTMTGTIVVDAHGENRIVVGMGAMAGLTAEHAHLIAERIRPESVVVVQNEAPPAFSRALLELARERGARTVYNPAPAVSAVGIDEIWPLVDHLIPNATEAAHLVGGDARARSEADTAAALARRTGCRVVMTVGERGAVISDGYRVRTVATPRVVAVDTTGAGDCFTGAFATALAAGEDELDAARFACAAASLAVTRPGVVDALPFRADLVAVES